MTKLPGENFGFSQLDYIRDLSKSANAVFLTTLLACVFLLLTTYSTKDLQLLTKTGVAKLPVLGIDVPTKVFFGFAPWVVFFLFVTFQMYMQRLWEQMARLPAYFPDGTSADSKTPPWLVNDLIVLTFRRLRQQRTFGTKLQILGFGLVAYAVAPATLLVALSRCLVIHDEAFLVGQIAVCTATLVSMLWSLHHLVFTFRNRDVVRDKSPLKPFRRYAVSSGFLQVCLGAAFIAAMLGQIHSVLTSVPERLSVAQASLSEGWCPPNGRLGKPPFTFSDFFDLATKRLNHLRSLKDDEGKPLELDLGASNRLATDLGQILPTSNSGPFLTGQTEGVLDEDHSRRPTSWQVANIPNDKGFTTAADEVIQRYCSKLPGSVKSMNDSLEGVVPVISFGSLETATNLRYLRARGAFLVNADFRGADLTGADLTDCELRGSRFVNYFSNVPRRATLKLACLGNASLAGVDLAGVDLRFSDLRGTNLTGSKLAGADLSWAVAHNAMLTGADLTGAKLTGADLGPRYVTGEITATYFDPASITVFQREKKGKARWYPWPPSPGAVFAGANLTGAFLQGSVLVNSNFAVANLTGAQMQGAYLIGARLTGSQLDKATLEAADLTRADLTKASCLRAAFDGANLTSTIFAAADLNGATFRGANLDGTNFEGVENLEQADLTNANYSSYKPPTWPARWNLAMRVDHHTHSTTIHYREQRYGEGSDERVRLVTP